MPLNATDFLNGLKIDMGQLSLGVPTEDPILLAGLYEGDIVISRPIDPRDIEIDLRNAVVDPNLLWPNDEVPYTISAVFGANERATIARAIAEFQNRTCLRFVPRQSQRDYVEFVRGNGCSSNVGRVGGRQQISIGLGCESVGVVIHEILHALGFYHEQSRPDRDEHIIIDRDNIQPGAEVNFQKQSSNEVQTLGEAYDIQSIMHYGAFDFAVDRTRPTIRARDPDYTGPIGQRQGFTDTDLRKVNKLYQCAANGTTPGLPRTTTTSTIRTTVRPPIPTTVRTTTSRVTMRTTARPTYPCRDYNRNCRYWAYHYECQRNPNYMLRYCRYSCRRCNYY